jgi:hypothetical protein
MCKVSGFKPSNTFEKNVEMLYRRNIQPDCNELWTQIWEGRDEYHHLKPMVPTNRKTLQSVAKSKIITLHDAESRIFAFDVVDGAIKPKYAKYWPQTDNGNLNVFLRFEP